MSAEAQGGVLDAHKNHSWCLSTVGSGSWDVGEARPEMALPRWFAASRTPVSCRGLPLAPLSQPGLCRVSPAGEAGGAELRTPLEFL